MTVKATTVNMFNHHPNVRKAFIRFNTPIPSSVEQLFSVELLSLYSNAKIREVITIAVNYFQSLISLALSQSIYLQRRMSIPMFDVKSNTNRIFYCMDVLFLNNLVKYIQTHK